MKTFIPVFLLLTLCATTVLAQGSDFVIDVNRAYAYLLFDHIGKGPRFFDDEPETRIWFRFVNNCRVPITLHTFGVPDASGELRAFGVPSDHSDGKFEVGVMYDVVADPYGGPFVAESLSEVVESPSEGGRPKASSAMAEKQQQMPRGYNFEVGSLTVIRPEESLQFSIPISHLSKDWHIEIPYEFRVPPGKCCRPENVGGTPKMLLSYSEWYLPPEVRKQLEGKR